MVDVYLYKGARQFLVDAEYATDETYSDLMKENEVPEVVVSHINRMQSVMLDEIKQSRGIYHDNIGAFHVLLTKKGMELGRGLSQDLYPSLSRFGSNFEGTFERIDVREAEDITKELASILMTKEAVLASTEPSQVPDSAYTADLSDMPDYSDVDTSIFNKSPKGPKSSKSPKNPKKKVQRAAAVRNRQVEAVKEQLERMQENKKFDEQCFIMAYLNNYASFFRTKVIEESPLKHVLIAETDSSSPIINSFSNFPDLRALQDLTTDKLSYMYPKIELYKVYVEKTSKGFRKVPNRSRPFIFETSETRKGIDDILLSNQGRGTGVGIKSFTWKYTGDNPATAQRLVEADLQIFIQDLAYFVKGFPSSEKRANYTDLISFAVATTSEGLPTGRKTQPCDPHEDEVLSTHSNEQEQVEIEARVGWNVPLSKEEFFTKEELDAIRSNETVISLSTKDFDFKFNQDGTVTLSIQYIGRLEGLLESNRANLFPETQSEKSKRKEAESVIKLERKARGESLALEKEKAMKAISAIGDDSDEAQAARIAGLEALSKKKPSSPADAGPSTPGQALMAEYEGLRKERFEAILREIENMDRIYFLKLDLDTISQCVGGKKGSNYTFLASSQQAPEPFPPSEAEKLREAVRNKIDNHRKKSINTEKRNKNKPKGVDGSEISLDILDSSNNYIFPFIYVGDILEAAAKILNQNMDQKEMQYRIITSSFVYRDLHCKRKVVNIADIPISLNAFTNWYTDNFIAKFRGSLPFIKFVRKMMSNLVFKALGKACFNSVGNNFKGGTKINIVTVSKELDSKLQETRRFKISDILNDKNLPRDSQPGGSYEYVVLSCDAYPMNFAGDREHDENNGIMHMHIGRDRGLIKEIEFTKQSIPGLRESFITRGSALDKIRLPFNTSITMYGYPFIIPGCKFFVDPTFSGMGDTMNPNSVARKLGLGGYYVTTVASNTISDGVYTTEINGQFESFPKEVPIVKQEEANTFRKTLKADSAPIQKSGEMFSGDSAIYDQLTIEGLGSGNTLDFSARFEARNALVIDELLEREGKVRENLSDKELHEFEVRALRLVNKGMVKVTYAENSAEILRIEILEEPPSINDAVASTLGISSEEATQLLDTRFEQYLLDGIADGMTTEEATLAALERVRIEDGGESEDSDVIARQLQYARGARGINTRVQTQFQHLKSIINGPNPGSELEAEIISFYEESLDIRPRFDGRDVLPSEKDVILRAGRQVFRDVAITEVDGATSIQAVVKFDSGEQIRIVPYSTPELRRRSNLIVARIVVDNDPNSGNVRGKVRVSAPGLMEPTLTNPFFGQTPEEVISMIRTAVEASYPNSPIEYITDINVNSFPERTLLTRNIRELDEEINRAESSKNSAFVDFMRDRTEEVREIYENSMEIVISSEISYYNLLEQREIIVNGSASGRFSFDPESRSEFLRANYPYTGPDLRG